MSVPLPLRRLVARDRLLLEVDGAGDVRHASADQCRAAGRVDQGLGLSRARELLVVDGDVAIEGQQIDFLMVIGAEEVVVGLARDGKHRRPVLLGVIEAVQEMNRAGPRGGDADAEAARELGVAAGHEGRGLLVADLDEAHLVLPRPEGLHQPIDAVAGQPEDHVHFPVDQPIDDELGSRP